MLTNEDCFVPGRGGAGLPAAEPALKPSQAMRIGAALRPQCTGTPFSMGRSCALGAMFEGYGGGYGASAAEVHAFTAARLGVYNACHVWIANDSLGWTRERIADWLEEQGL